VRSPWATAMIQGQIVHAGPVRPVTGACIGAKKQISCGKHEESVSEAVSRIVSIGRTRLGGLCFKIILSWMNAMPALRASRRSAKKVPILDAAWAIPGSGDSIRQLKTEVPVVR
jgi:hypothetical protein